MSIVQCEKVFKTFGSFRALDNITFSIKENTITGLIGRNGAGKTTLLKILAGYWRETGGEVRVFSERPFDNLNVAANTIYIDDRIVFSDTMTLFEIMGEADRFYTNWDADFAKRLFHYFALKEDQLHQHLSKGKKRIFNSIIGIASRCALTILDEPTNGMDAAVRKDFYRALLKDYLNYPRTIIISSHHLDEVEDILENVLLMDKGKQHLHLSIDELRTYAVGLTGRTSIVEQCVNKQEVFFEKQIGIDQTYAVVENNITIDQARRLGLTVSAIRPSDVCVYLTNESKGGIDDVFK